MRSKEEILIMARFERSVGWSKQYIMYKYVYIYTLRKISWNIKLYVYF
jgi:hypothetical protein